MSNKKAPDTTSVEELKEKNAQLETKLKEERAFWNNGIKTLVEQLKDNAKLTETQVTQLSFRQIFVEKYISYKILAEKKEILIEQASVQKFRNYVLDYDIKLSAQEKQQFISADLAAQRSQLKMLNAQIDFFQESIKTMDSLGYAIKNKIAILNDGLF